MKCPEIDHKLADLIEEDKELLAEFKKNGFKIPRGDNFWKCIDNASKNEAEFLFSVIGRKQFLNKLLKNN